MVSDTGRVHPKDVNVLPSIKKCRCLYFTLLKFNKHFKTFKNYKGDIIITVFCEYLDSRSNYELFECGAPPFFD